MNTWYRSRRSVEVLLFVLTCVLHQTRRWSPWIRRPAGDQGISRGAWHTLLARHRQSRPGKTMFTSRFPHRSLTVSRVGLCAAHGWYDVSSSGLGSVIIIICVQCNCNLIFYNIVNAVVIELSWCCVIVIDHCNWTQQRQLECMNSLRTLFQSVLLFVRHCILFNHFVGVIVNDLFVMEHL